MTEDRPEGDDTNVTLPETSSPGLELELCTTHLNPVQPIQSSQSEITVEQSDPEENTSCKICVLKGPFTTIDALFLLGGMILHITDVVTDIIVGVQYLRNGHKLWSTMTFIFVLLPSVIVHFFSFAFFKDDEKTDHRKKGFLAKLNLCVIHVLQLGVIIRYWRTLKLGLQSRNNDAKDELKKEEHTTLYLLCLLEAFMESAPQLVLQVYIMVESDDFYWLTPASTIVSLISLASTIEGYNKSERDKDPDLAKTTYYMLMIRIVWRLFTITARVIALVLFAAIFKWWVFVMVGAHWVVMIIWILHINKWENDDDSRCMNPNFCGHLFGVAVLGIIYIFCFFIRRDLIKEGKTRSRAAVYYTIVFIENTIMISLWYSEEESRETWYGIPALFFVWGGFFIGIFIFFCLVPCLQPEWDK